MDAKRGGDWWDVFFSFRFYGTNFEGASDGAGILRKELRWVRIFKLGKELASQWLECGLFQMALPRVDDFTTGWIPDAIDVYRQSGARGVLKPSTLSTII